VGEACLFVFVLLVSKVLNSDRFSSGTFSISCKKRISQEEGKGEVGKGVDEVRSGNALKWNRTWWLGKISVSAITTFSLRPAAKTTTSAMSSGLSGSQSLYECQGRVSSLIWTV
jgi:hypothetical protein